jgi:TolB protein
VLARPTVPLLLGVLMLFPSAAQAGDGQSTTLISRSVSGGTPNGASENPVISADRRFASIVAYESVASNIIAGDDNGLRDVFAVKRGGSFANTGTPWQVGQTLLISRGRTGPADGPSYAPAVDGSTTTQGSCVAFLSDATNLVGGDTNGVTDAFISQPVGSAPRRVSVRNGQQFTTRTTGVAVSPDCSRIAFVNNGVVYSVSGSRVTTLRSRGAAADPSWGLGKAGADDLVFGDRGGVYISRGGTGSPKLLAAGGRDPVYTNIDGEFWAYVKGSQVYWHGPGRKDRVVSAYRGRAGNKPSTSPQIGNDGLYVAFESAATNLGLNAGGERGDKNKNPDVFLYTGVRDLTTVQSVARKGVPLRGGGRHQGMSYYANYMVFDSPSPLNARTGTRQIWMRWLGGV